MHESVDVVVIGGGIVGLATAWKLQQRRPGITVAVLEKEAGVAVHQTGHNSGVIHSGIYYEPGSLKATLCKQGAEDTKTFAREHDIPFRVTGKLLVATDESEQQRMLALFERAKVNGLDVQLLDAAELRRAEPHVRGCGAIEVPTTGIIDYRRVSQVLAELVVAAGGIVETGVAVTGIAETSEHVRVDTAAGTWTATNLVACAGLQADRMAAMAGLEPEVQIIPFRGEYFALPTARNGLVEHLIYPIPDPELPFLGVHLSPTMHGHLTVGPNAVLGFARERYRKGAVAPADVAEYLRYPGMWKLARNNIRTGARELSNSLFKRGYLAQCRKYCPELTLDDLVPMEAGIRAQAVRPDGSLVHDFLLKTSPRSIHVLNAPSPAATSALPIGQTLATQLFP
ncbi:hydroxyglutarate oxidase [Mycobacterium sp. MS1601]|uniref:L-2-hydroxyglutarate oxidase n=1 Tax=Mycobacterium sp. MS1601 TaxID=1936029 RepID=UPI0009796D08|nr:L-2-hydroxyglutarate oxidase [Mycobacterium sp. MS1601]AQA02354.1 hydroxyglutarate oxidase [Mycobacterium sp. MS1601]